MNGDGKFSKVRLLFFFSCSDFKSFGAPYILYTTAIEKHSKLSEGGYATVLNVDKVPVKHEDRMETFFMVGF